MLFSSNIRSAQKKNVIQERVREEHENNKINEMEEEYEKEEREKMALEMYDKWMVCYSKYILEKFADRCLSIYNKPFTKYCE